MKTGFFVSRQNYYYTSQLVVEVVAGGSEASREQRGVDYAGPDMLVEAYQHLGEGIEYEDPREAVKKAIAICREWRKDDGRQDVHVAVGNTGGMGVELEPTTFKAARKWAKRVWAQMPKCDQCGGLLPRNGESYYVLAGDEDRGLQTVEKGKFCSEVCVGRACLAYLDEIEE